MRFSGPGIALCKHDRFQKTMKPEGFKLLLSQQAAFGSDHDFLDQNPICDELSHTALRRSSPDGAGSTQNGEAT